MKINNVVILVLTAATLLSGCGGGDGGNSDGNNEASSATELEGTWVGPCISADSPDTNEFYRETDTFSGNTLSVISIFYTDSTCSIPVAGVSTWTSSGTFVIGDAVTTSSGWSAKEVDLITLKENGVDVKTKTTGYTIFSITNGTLYGGKVTPENDGSSAAKRPVDLDFTKLYTKS